MCARVQGKEKKIQEGQQRTFMKTLTLIMILFQKEKKFGVYYLFDATDNVLTDSGTPLSQAS